MSVSGFSSSSFSSQILSLSFAGFFCAIASMIANKCMQQRVAVVVVVVFYFDFIKSSSECVGSRFCGDDTLHNVNNNDNKKRVA